MNKDMAEQWRKILRKAFDRWHDRTLERVKRIFNDK